MAGGTEDDGGRPSRDLAGRPQSLAPATAPPGATTTPSAGASAPSGGTTGRPTAGSTGGPPGPTTGPSAGVARPSGPAASEAPYHVVGTVSDRSGDTEGSAPPYVDIAAVTIEDNGTNARVTLTMHGTVPAKMPAAETAGVGIDFFRQLTQVESDYQLFADGQPEGWFAYLHTPKGFVKYPGTFGIGGRRIVFTVPWSALGGPSAGRFAGFADWTRQAEPANVFSEDHAPNLANASYQR